MLHDVRKADQQGTEMVVIDFTEVLTALIVQLNLADSETTPIGAIAAERVAYEEALLRWN